jgi:hypothetical protein
LFEGIAFSDKLLAGFTRPCINAIVRFIHFGDSIEKAMLISHIRNDDTGTHSFLLTVNEHDLVAIKSGFSSGYHGEGPRGLSTALQLLLRHGTKIDEYMVEKDLIDRIDGSCLLNADIDELENSRPAYPIKYYEYIDNREFFGNKDRHLKSVFPLTIPLRLIDLRIIDLALSLENQPDVSLFTGYRRLEDFIRKRTGLDGLGGAKLLSKAFQGNDSILHWPSLDPAESQGRALLFTGTFMAYRNKRAHSEPPSESEEAYREFLLLNELFLLESQAALRAETDDK